MYGFEEFIADVKWRVRFLSRRVADPLFDWPGLLFLDVARGLSVEAFAIGQTVGERNELVATLVARLVEERPRRFCWLMPCEREAGGYRDECLLLVFGERGRAAASLVEVIRVDGRAPRLGPFNDGAFGRGARRISGRFVEPLLAALER